MMTITVIGANLTFASVSFFKFAKDNILFNQMIWTCKQKRHSNSLRCYLIDVFPGSDSVVVVVGWDKNLMLNTFIGPVL